MLFPGQRIAVDLHLPSAGDSACSGRIVSLGRRGEDILWVFEPDRDGNAALSALSDHLIFAYGAEPALLKSLGLPIRFAKERLEVRYADGRGDLERARAWTERAHRVAGMEGQAGTSDGGRRGSALTLLACIEGNLIGSATLSFPVGGDTLAVEALHLDRDNPADEVLRGILVHAARALVLSNRARLTAACTPAGEAALRLHGFRPGPSGRPAEGRSATLALTREAVLFGKGIPTRIWARDFSGLARDLVERGSVSLGPLDGFLRRAKAACMALIPGRGEGTEETAGTVRQGRKP
jgi:hypothetical protein